MRCGALLAGRFRRVALYLLLDLLPHTRAETDTGQRMMYYGYRECPGVGRPLKFILTCRSEHARRVHAVKKSKKNTVTGLLLLGCTKLRLTAEFLGACSMFCLFCTAGHVY